MSTATEVAGFIPGGLGLILSDYLSWSTTFFIVSCFMLVGILMTLLIGETSDSKDAPTDFKDAVIRPFTEFFQREGGARQALLILAFMFLYKIGDNMATALSTPFYLDLGFTKTVIGSVVKVINFWSMMIGTFVGGATIHKLGINRSLWVWIHSTTLNSGLRRLSRSRRQRDGVKLSHSIRIFGRRFRYGCPCGLYVKKH